MKQVASTSPEYRALVVPKPLHPLKVRAEDELETALDALTEAFFPFDGIYMEVFELLSKAEPSEEIQ